MLTTEIVFSAIAVLLTPLAFASVVFAVRNHGALPF